MARLARSTWFWGTGPSTSPSLREIRQVSIVLGPSVAVLEFGIWWERHLHESGALTNQPFRYVLDLLAIVLPQG